MIALKLRGMGKLQRNMYSFAREYQGWHSIGADRISQQVAKSLVKREVIEVNKFNQFKCIYFENCYVI